MTTYKNVCPFCNRNDSPPTREHVLAQWISEEFPGEGKWITEDIMTGHFRGPSKQIDLVTKKICERCNTGWMSKLEAAVKPTLIPLIKGQQITLTSDDQLLIARWLAKTAMAHEFLDKPPYYFQPHERKALESSLEVPEPTLFFIGHYGGPKAGSYFAVHIPLLAGKPEQPMEIDGYSATFTIKQLALQVFSLRKPPAPPAYLTHLTLALPETLATMAVQIWPIVMPKFTWPPPFYFAGDDLDTFKDRWITALGGKGTSRPPPSA